MVEADGDNPHCPDHMPPGKAQPINKTKQNKTANVQSSTQARPGPQPHHATLRLSSFQSKNNLLDANQSGFRRGHSTETALLSVIEASQMAKADSKSSVLILLDLSAAFDNVRNSYPPSHHLASQGLQLAGLNPISRLGLSRWPGEGRYPEHINWSMGFLRDQFLDPSSSSQTLHLWVTSYKHMVSPTCAMLMTHSSLSFRPDNPTVAAQISGCLADISAWMEEHHLQLNLAKTELLVFPATPNLQHDFTIQTTEFGS